MAVTQLSLDDSLALESTKERQSRRIRRKEMKVNLWNFVPLKIKREMLLISPGKVIPTCTECTGDLCIKKQVTFWTSVSGCHQRGAEKKWIQKTTYISLPSLLWYKQQSVSQPSLPFSLIKLMKARWLWWWCKLACCGEEKRKKKKWKMTASYGINTTSQVHSIHSLLMNYPGN